MPGSEGQIIQPDPDQRLQGGPRTSGGSGRTALAITVLLAAAALLAWWFWPKDLPPAAMPDEQPFVAPPVPGDEPEVRYPVEPLPTESVAPPLPVLNDSDPDLAGEVIALLGSSAFAELFVADDLARRFVATVDNLPRRYLPRERLPVRGAPGGFVAGGDPDAPILDADNHGRYAPFASAAARLDVDAAVTVYRRFYPLLQQAYEDLGYPGRYFNDRLVEAIDDLLAAPDLEGPVPLVRPGVLYEFADPALESLSMGQKILIRMGPANAAIIKAKLAELRALLAVP